MGKKKRGKSQTLPPSPSHSASSSEFEFTVAVSPRKITCPPADELFYKGQLLPLHLSPRLSMVRTLLLASPSTSSSSDAATTASRDSTGSSNDSHSSFNSELVLFTESRDSSRRASSAADDDEININIKIKVSKPSKYFSLSRFSSVFKRDAEKPGKDSPVKRMSASAKEVIRKYVKKVKPLYERLQSQKSRGLAPETVSVLPAKGGFSHSFSGNLRYPRTKGCISSCPSSIRSSPSHSGVLCRRGFVAGKCVSNVGVDSTTSSMEELQSAIQGAIAHCKNSLLSTQ